MIRLRSQESGAVKEWEVSFDEFERMVRTGNPDPAIEVYSDNLTQGQWKPLGDLTMYRKAAAEREGGGSLGLRDVVERVHQPRPMLNTQGGTMWTCSACGKENREDRSDCWFCKAQSSEPTTKTASGVAAPSAEPAASAPRFCQNCGAKLPAAAGYCGSCGAAAAAKPEKVAAATVPIMSGVSQQARTATFPPKPDKLKTVAIMTLVSGIVNCLGAIFFFHTYQTQIAPQLAQLSRMGYQLPAGRQFLVFYLVISGIYAAILAVLEIRYFTKIIHDPVKVAGPARYLAIMEIAGVVCTGLIPLVAGVIALATYGKDEVKSYFAQKG